MCACNVFGLWRQFALHEASCRARWCAKESSNLSRYTTQAMQPRRQSLLGHGLSPRKLRHATSQAKPARSRAVTLYYTSHATSQAETARSRAVASQAAPCNLAGKACSVTGCRPIKRQSPTASYVSELPTKQREFVFLHGL